MSRKAITALSLALVCSLAGALLAQAATPQRTAAHHAVDYIRTLQKADGGFPYFGSNSEAGGTIDAILAFAAQGTDPDDVENDGNSPIDYLETQAASYATTADHAAKLVIGLVAAGEDPRDFAGDDWVAKMQSYYDSATHRYGVQIIDQALYLLARESLGLSAQSGTVAVLESTQLTDGCWEFADGFGCDTNSTAMAVQALITAGVDSDDASIEAALDYFESAQNSDGGFPYLIPSDSDANSTAWVLQALKAAGEDVDSGGPWDKPGGHTPMQALLSFQNPANGAFTYAGDDNAYATYQAVPALLLQPLLLPPEEEEEEATETPAPTQTPVATSTAMPEVSPTPSLAIAPAPTVESQVLPAAVAPVTMPRALASAGEGSDSDGTRPAVLVALLAAAGGFATVGYLARRRSMSKE